MKKLVLIGLLLCSSTAFGQFIVDISRQKAAYLSAVSTLLPVPNGSIATDTTIPLGSSAILTWDSVRANSCTGTGFSTGGKHFGTVTVSPVTTTVYTVTCDGKPASATVTVSGNLIDAAATYCAANGGGTGSSASPWRYNCIQAAVTAASDGDTIFLAGGNWRLDTADLTFVTVTKVLNFVGVDSGNTFDIWGHVNNPNGIDQCPTAGTSITCVYSTGTSLAYNTCNTGPNHCAGYITFTPCTSATISRIFIDSSAASDGGGPWGLINLLGCTGSVLVDNVRHIPHAGSEAAFYLNPAVGGSTSIQNSTFAEPSAGGGYPNAQILQMNGEANTVIISNNAFYQGAYNPIGLSNLTFVGNQQYDYADGLGDITFTAAYGAAGAGVGGPWAGACPEAGAPITGNPYCNGDVGIFTKNNLFYAGTHYFGLGGGVNDPGSSGGLNDLNWTGNWIIADDGEINACIWSSCGPVEVQPTSATCTGSGTITITYTTPTDTGIRAGDSFLTWGFQPYQWTGIGTAATGNATTITETGSGTCPGASPTTMGFIGQHLVEGMTINTAVDVNCAESYNDSYGFNAFNNSIIGTTQAVFNEINTGGIQCRLGNPTPYTFIQISFYGFNAQKNYLSSPNNKYFINSHVISPILTGNFCTPAVGSLGAGCTTSGFTTLPTAAFTLGTLSNGVINIVSPSFTAQFGAVQWLISTSPTTPLSSDSRWSSNNSFWSTHPASLPPSTPNSYVPPTHLSGVLHGDTVYMWVMDSTNHVSAAASAVVP